MKASLILITALFILLTTVGCKREENEAVGPISESAVFMAVNINSPEGYLNYIGAFPDVPTTIDKSKLVEFGNSAHVAFPYKGSIFTFGSTTKALSKWSLDQALTLTKTATLGLSDKGLPAYPAIAIHSDTRGFIFDINGGRVIEFNPTTMTITETITVPKPANNYAYMGYLPAVYGNKIISNLSESDWDNKKITERVGVVSFDVTTKQLTYHFDTRSTTGYEYFVDSKGYFYSLPDMYSSAYMRNFGGNKTAPKTSLVRFDINAGKFDETYSWPIEDILGGYTVNTYPINDTQIFLSYLPKPLATTINADNIWTEGKVKVKMFDLTTGKATDIPGLTGDFNSNSAGEGRYNVDGVLYVPMSIRVGDNLTTKIYKITETGATLHGELTNTWISEISKLR